MTWIYNGSEYTEPQEEYYGFVYIITNTLTNRKYIGKKLFWFKKTKQVKGKKKRYLVPSDWLEYWGSSKELQQDIIAQGNQHFTREIIHLCKNKGECSYLEAKEQFDREVLMRQEEYYNDWIMCRVHRKHIQKK